eukprot:gene1297-1639_t
MKVLISIILLVSLATIASSLSTPLENFVNRPDDNVGQFYIHKTIKDPRYTAYVLNFTSLNWLTPDESSNPKWWHWLVVCVPNIVLSDYGYLEVDGGVFTSEARVTPMIENICVQTNSVAAHLWQNPNQPTVFHKDGVPRVEDGLLAYTWDQFMNNRSKVEWIGQFPLTKAVVKAMDAVQSFVKSKYYLYRVNHFVVSGASKRGWASWLAAAIDPRVKAVIPVVFPNVNLIQNTINHYRAYGGWSFAYGDYYIQGLMRFLNTPQFEWVAKEIDPIYFVDRLRTKPKYVVNAVGDEYFLPDSSSFFWPQLLGEKHLRIHPNAGHWLQNRDPFLIAEVTSYYKNIINHQKLPEFDWSVVPDPTTNQTTVHVTLKDSLFHRPTSVVVYQANSLSTTRRDWRYQSCDIFTGVCTPNNVTWVPTPLTAAGEDFYKFTVSAPTEGGWRGAFVELTYQSLFGVQRYTTDFFYAPFTFPFENCGLNCQNQPFPI